MAPGTTRTVRLVDVPVDLYRRARQHTDDVLRELVIIAGAEPSDGTRDGTADLARRADLHREGRLGLADAADATVDAAAERGEAYVSLSFAVGGAVADWSSAWPALLDEIDALCRNGTMLAVPAGERLGAYLRWFCGEFVQQLRYGAPPCPWPRYAASALGRVPTGT